MGGLLAANWRIVGMAEVSVLRRKLHRLSNCLDPVVLSTALYAEEIIDDRTWEEARHASPTYDRCLKLLEIVLRKVKASPSVFEKFCNILEEEPITANIATELRENFRQERIQKNNSKTINSTNSDNENSISENEEDLETPRKRQRTLENSVQETNGSPQKRLRVVKLCTIDGDKVLLDIAMEISDKWNEVGISLGVGFKTLQSAIGSLGTTVPDHRKAFLMLQEWKSRAAKKYSYQTLAPALEENGLASCAMKFCYTEK